MSFFIKNATLLMEEGIIQKGCLAVDGSVIDYVGPEVPMNKPYDRVIDARGNVLMPGLVNTHTHLAMTLLRGCADDLPLQRWLQEYIFPLEAQLTAEDVYWGALLGIAEMLRGGTTAFHDMYFFEEQVAQAVAQTGIKAVLGIGLMGQDEKDNMKIENGKAFYRDYHHAADGRIKVNFAPHAEYTCSETFLQKVVEASAQLDAGFHIHVAETRAEKEGCMQRHGMSPVVFLNSIGLFDRSTIAAHGVFVSPEDMAILAEKKVTVAHNPASNLKLGSGIAPVAEMLKAGVLVALGTDGAASNNQLNMFEEMRLCALLQKGKLQNPGVLPANKALDMATVQGAKALGFSSGRLKAGDKADFIMVDIHAPHLFPHAAIKSHLVYAAGGQDVKMTVVNGKILYENQTFYTLDIEKVYRKVEAISQRLYPMTKS